MSANSLDESNESFTDATEGIENSDVKDEVNLDKSVNSVGEKIDQRNNIENEENNVSKEDKKCDDNIEKNENNENEKVDKNENPTSDVIDNIKNENENENIPSIVIDNVESKNEENENIPSIVIDSVESKNEENEANDVNEEKEESEENLAENLEIKGDFHNIFRRNLAESEDATELKRTLSNLYDKIKILSKDNINTVGINDDKEDDEEFNMMRTSEEKSESKLDEIHKYYQSFSGTVQHFKPMEFPSSELCNTISYRYHNNINIHEFFEHLENITNQNASAINNSLSSLVSLMHGPGGNSCSQLDITKDNNNRGTLKHQKKELNTADAKLNKNFRSYFKFAKKKINTRNNVFVSNIASDSAPIPKLTIPNIPITDELQTYDPLSLGIYYHNHQQYDIADYYFTLSSVDNNAIGLYLHGMYMKYGHGISGCSPELGFQYLLKSAEASIQSIPTINKNNEPMIQRFGKIDEDNENEDDKNEGIKLQDTQRIPLNDTNKEESDKLVAEKMLMRTNIANMLSNLTDEEFETWIVRCIVSLPIYEIGQSFLHGHGVPKSTSKAVYCFNVAAYMGDADAQLALAKCYNHGVGVKKTRKMAAMWYRKAHANGKCIYGESWVWKSKYD